MLPTGRKQNPLGVVCLIVSEHSQRTRIWPKNRIKKKGGIVFSFLLFLVQLF